jgi:hypothetical protein
MILNANDSFTVNEKSNSHAILVFVKLRKEQFEEQIAAETKRVSESLQAIKLIIKLCNKRKYSLKSLVKFVFVIRQSLVNLGERTEY